MDSLLQQLWAHAIPVALTVGLMIAWMLVVVFGVYALLNRLGAWWDHRRGRRTPEEEGEYWRRRTELRTQLWQMEQRIRDEQLPDEERERALSQILAYSRFGGRSPCG